MTPAEFIAKWHDNPLSERAGAQPFFLDLCTMLGVAPPNDPDNYCFERGAQRTGARHGWADVWMRGHFGWENKGPDGDLPLALKQLMTYALALDNPPLLIVSNRAVTQIHTHFTGTPSETHTIRLQDIGTPENLQKLRWIFAEPEKFRPGRTVLDITAAAAGRFADIAGSMAARGHERQKIAHFLIQCLFCMFAEDIGLLPKQLFERVIARRGSEPAKLTAALAELFVTMRTGGDFLLEDIHWFNGGLFEMVDPVEMTADEAAALLSATRMDWSAIEPAILGTLFERGLDPAVRAPLGANYTDPDTIMKLVQPVVIAPLEREWVDAREQIAALMSRYEKGGKGAQAAQREAASVFLAYVGRLKDFRVLDPACGSGNFLYLALRALKDLEHRANLDVEALGLHRELSLETGPANVRGIEINGYAAELARVTVWIGEIQWMLRHGYDCRRQPVLAPLDQIEHRDALLNPDGSEAAWPVCDVIVGNPPFLGDKRMRGELGVETTARIRSCFHGRLPGGADLVTYWFEKARTQIVDGHCEAAGLVATNSIRGGANRRVLDRIAASTRIFAAWSDEPWVNDGAAVRVSLVCFGDRRHTALDGRAVAEIYADLSSTSGVDLASAASLSENAKCAFNGVQKTGPFEVSANVAREWLLCGGNPNGRPNSDVLAPYHNGIDLTRRPRDVWIIDFGWVMSSADAALYEAPYEYARRVIFPVRETNALEAARRDWWRHWRPRPEMRGFTSRIPRYIVTAEVSKHRVFGWLQARVLADKNLIVIARTDATTFGILHSRMHELWALRLGTSLEDRPRYTPTTTFETFPFPSGMTPADTAAGAPTGSLAEAIATAADRLVELRDNWLNPPEWIERVPEVVPGYPERIVARQGHEQDLKKRTLTKLYNARPAWLANAHLALDAAVAAAYGWADYAPQMTDEEILRRLLELNLARAANAAR